MMQIQQNIGKTSLFSFLQNFLFKCLQTILIASIVLNPLSVRAMDYEGAGGHLQGYSFRMLGDGEGTSQTAKPSTDETSTDKMPTQCCGPCLERVECVEDWRDICQQDGHTLPKICASLIFLIAISTIFIVLNSNCSCDFLNICAHPAGPSGGIKCF